MHFNTQQHVTQVTPTSVPTVLLTPTLNQNYTAADIMNDFHTNGLPTSQEDYTQSLNQFLDAFGGTGTSELTVKTLPTSYVFFRDPTVCVGGCDTGGDTWLGVYSSVTDAQASHNEVEQYTQYTNNAGNIPYQLPADDIQQGRCLLITYDAPTTGYAQVVDKYCI
jgi:hypothetical protein